MLFGNIHPLWLVVLLAVVLIIFGPGKLPELGGAIGRAIQEFRKASTELKDEVSRATTSEPASTSEAPKSQVETKG
jgi:sec-independent protein translocase protein TatA